MTTQPMNASPSLSLKTAELLQQLGIDPQLISGRPLPYYEEATELVHTDTHRSGKMFYLTSPASKAWQAMKAAAEADGVELYMVSAFRGLEYQCELIERKLANGQSAEAILTVLAPPGCSEHHTGRAIDINTPGCAAADESFADTAAYAWLVANARHFGFVLSFPPDNEWGFIYEPWHWCWHSEPDQ
ncbi:D-alanyl-D-alanine carboxypeptidase family protein [Pokkaliibacter sp. CJK22405]|uniref:M15 family metallopeptidase n=1 Tax=Pokkaliibacter sp. CJK22405 TaxID=3384615 RepID=UPI0039849D64